MDGRSPKTENGGDTRFVDIFPWLKVAGDNLMLYRFIGDVAQRLRRRMPLGDGQVGAPARHGFASMLCSSRQGFPHANPQKTSNSLASMQTRSIVQCPKAITLCIATFQK